MGGFHILLVNLKIFYKKYGLLGLRGCWVKSNILADGSVDKAFEGQLYSRGTRLHKQTFEALFHFKFKSFEKDFQLNFISKVKKLGEESTHRNLPGFYNDEDIKQIKQQILAHSGTMGKWVTDYIRDVSKFLSRIAAYRHKNIEPYLRAQRELLLLLFAFSHQNYSRYLTYHQFELQGLNHRNSSAYEQLKTYGMGAALTGRKFSTIPGGLVTEVTVNCKIKIRE